MTARIKAKLLLGKALLVFKGVMDTLHQRLLLNLPAQMLLDAHA
jgi:hypothetical protein